MWYSLSSSVWIFSTTLSSAIPCLTQFVSSPQKAISYTRQKVRDTIKECSINLEEQLQFQTGDQFVCLGMRIMVYEYFIRLFICLLYNFLSIKQHIVLLRIRVKKDNFTPNREIMIYICVDLGISYVCSAENNAKLCPFPSYKDR